MTAHRDSGFGRASSRSFERHDFSTTGDRFTGPFPPELRDRRTAEPVVDRPSAPRPADGDAEHKTTKVYRIFVSPCDVATAQKITGFFDGEAYGRLDGSISEQWGFGHWPEKGVVIETATRLHATVERLLDVLLDEIGGRLAYVTVDGVAYEYDASLDRFDPWTPITGN